jgi:hypothetical protein
LIFTCCFGLPMKKSTLHGSKTNQSTSCYSTTPKCITTFNVFAYFWHKNLAYKPTHSSIKLTTLCHNLFGQKLTVSKVPCWNVTFGRQSIVPKVPMWIHYKLS